MITRNHPRTYRGITFWAEFVKDFRQKLDNWTAQSIKNFDLTVNPQEDMAIVIMSGDKFTGLSGSAMPSTKNPKGAMTLQLVENNQLSLFPEMRENPIIKEGCQYWILLYYKAEDEIRLELSLPNNIDGEGKINSWLERIPLPSCKVGAGSTEPDITDKSSAIDFDIEIK
jgi:hypothetical protein